MASAGSIATTNRRDEMAAISSSSPGELILKKLFAQFVVTAESKLKHVSTQPLANPLIKYIQRGDDPTLDQLLASLKEVARFSLRSMLTTLFEWRKKLMKEIQSRTTWTVSTSETSDSPQTLSRKEVEYYSERQQLAVEFIFCMTLTEILQQLPVHPVPENFIHTIEGLAFTHFKAQEPLKERSTNNPNVANAKRVADLYAEVIGVLSQVRFLSVRMRFFAELRNPQNTLSVIISVIEGLSFVRVKMYPVEELEGWLVFLQDCANYMIESGKGEKVRHAMSALLVEVLTPVAAVIKYEVSMPAFKKIVQTLYSHAYDQAKRKHSAAYIPLVTVLLAISEDAFFLNNWHNFVLQTIFPNLKRNDPKLQWIALDSLYRLLWIYLIRIKGEGNVTTYHRLKPIIELLFPRSGGRGLLLKDFPPNIFVKIIYFIARERVEFAMPDIVVDLVTKNRGGLNHERIIIGLRAFLMIADSLEKKEGDPPMPPALNSSSLLGSITRTKTKFLTNTLTEKIAKEIGIASYYPLIGQALGSILKQLDMTVGRPLVSTNSQVARAPEDALSGERKPKLDLLKTCVAAIPRLLPEGMGKEELIECLSRLTIHIDPELVKMSVTALLNIISNLPSWRPDIVQVFSVFVMRDIPDSTPLVLESSLKVLGQLLSHWRGLVISGSEDTGGEGGGSSSGREDIPFSAMCSVEACALVTFCSYRSMTRRLSLAILKEVRSCLEVLGANKVEAGRDSVRVLDIMEKSTPVIVKSYLAILTQKERADLRVNLHNLNLWWLADRNACFLEHGGGKESLRDAWSQCIIGLMEQTVLPASCPLAVQLAWPYILHRMMKAYTVLDNTFIVPERLDRAPQLRVPRGSFLSQPELFLWRNYLFFACCSAPPSSSPYPVPPTQGLYEAGLLLGDKHPRQYTARDLVHMIVPLIRTEGEIGEVVITALGLANPAAFGDLIEQFRPWLKDALDLRKSDNVKKRRRREIERVHITRVLAVAAGHGCFHLCPSALSKEGQVTQQVLNFISGIKLFLESESERSVPAAPNSDLRLHYATLISSLINSFPEGSSRARLLPSDMRRDMFFMIAGWAGGFWHQSTDDQDNKSTKQLRSTAFVSSVLHAMSSLVCCGAFFEPEALVRARYIYRWLENMLCSSEEKIQQLGQTTVQLLLQYNREPVLLKWVTDHCYASITPCATLCFHALCNTFAKNPSYPCNMITVLHVILYYTACQDHRTRERALQLLHILDRRFFASGERGSRRPELLGRITGSTYSNIHVAVSEELAFTNPELTLPLFSEMVRRFEEAPPFSRHVILQLMRPWLRNIELVEEIPRIQTSVMLDHALPSLVASKSTNPVLSGSGWGSLEGTHLVLHNLLYLTTKYGDTYSADVESLWSALSTWTFNIRVVLNYLARLACLAGNMSAILKQAKRVMVYFSHTHSSIIIHELLRELHCVDLITAEVFPSEAPPFYRVSGRGSESGSLKRDSSHHSTSWNIDEAQWAVNWRIEVRSNEGQATPLPAPNNTTFYASMKETLKLPCRQVAHLHRSNFALILLSEIVGDIITFDWLTHLPVLLHVVTLGLDLHRPIVYQHSKKLLCSLTVLLACRDDYRAACEARLTQHEAFLHSPSLLSLTSNEGGGGGDLQRVGSLNSLNEGKEGTSETSLARKARTLIKYISERECKRCWPFVDLGSYQKDCSTLPSCEVTDLCRLVDQILLVFQPSCNDSLKDKWSKIALQWATSCSSQQFASQSFQLCRALNVPLSSVMLREVLPRLAESVSDPSDELRNYVVEIMLSLENALNNSQEESLHPPGYSPEGHGRQVSDITPLPEEDIPVTTCITVSRDNSQTLSLTTTPTFCRTLTPTNSLPSSVTSSSRLPSIPLAQSCRTSTPALSVNTTPALEPPLEEATPPVVAPPTTLSSRPHFTHHRRNHSRGQSVTNLQDLHGPYTPDHTPKKDRARDVDGTPEHAHAPDQQGEEPLPVAEQPLPHSPPAASAGHHRNRRLRVSNSLDIDSEFDSKPHPPEGHTSHPPRVVATTNEEGSRRISAPPIHLMNLFEPLPGSGVQKAHITVETVGNHAHQHHGRPYSEVFPNSISVLSSNRMNQISSSVSGSLPSIATAKVMAPVIIPTVSSSAHTGVTPTQLSIVHSQGNGSFQTTPTSFGLTPGISISSQTTPTQVVSTLTTPTQGNATSQSTPTINEETSLDIPPTQIDQHYTSSEASPPGKEATPLVREGDQDEGRKEVTLVPLNGEGGGGGGGGIDTSGSSVDSTNIVRVPSHPDLHINSHSPPKKSSHLYLPPDGSPIIRARSVSQLLQVGEGEEGGEQEEKHYKRRSYSGSRETVPGYSVLSSSPSLLTKTPHQVRGSLDKLREKTHHVSSSSQFPSAAPLTQVMTAPPTHHVPLPPLSHQNSPTRENLRRRISADPERERAQSAGTSRTRNRPRSMFETGSAHISMTTMGSDFSLMVASDLLSQLFWTSVSLMLSDYEIEFSLALRLFDRATSKLDFKSDFTFTRLDIVRIKSKWEGFPGVLRVLLKGLSLANTTHSTRRLISKICPYVRRGVFDPSGSSGLPLCIMSLLPELLQHFDDPMDELVNTASNIAEACTSYIPQAQSNEHSQVLRDMGRLFSLYSRREFNNTCTIWLKSVCHYISKGYAHVTEEILKLMGTLLDQGCDTYHHSVLWILNEFLIKLEENSSVDMGLVTRIITRPVTQFIKGSLWQEALGILSLVVKNSSSLVQPTTPHIPMVDLGFFQESLPGPTLKFSVDLNSGSHDLRLAHDSSPQSSWRRPQGCQRITKEKLLSIINACGPLPSLYNSPSVIFMDDQAPLTVTYSESEEETEEEEIQSEEEMPSIRGSAEILDSSQPESSVINTIGDEFDFLNQYSDEEQSEEAELNVEGPFSAKKEEMYSSSLSSSQSSLYDEESELQDHTHNRTSIEPPTHMIEVPHRKHSRSTSPYFPSASPQSHDRSPRLRSLERSLDSIETTPPLADTPTKREEYPLSYIKEVTEDQPRSTEKDNIISEAPPTKTTPIIVTSSNVNDVSSSFGDETTPSHGEKTLVQDETLRVAGTSEATPPIEETDSREGTLSPVPMTTREMEEEDERGGKAMTRKESEDRQGKMESSSSSFDIITGGEEEEEEDEEEEKKGEHTLEKVESLEEEEERDREMLEGKNGGLKEKRDNKEIIGTEEEPRDTKEDKNQQHVLEKRESSEDDVIEDIKEEAHVTEQEKEGLDTNDKEKETGNKVEVTNKTEKDKEEKEEEEGEGEEEKRELSESQDSLPQSIEGSYPLPPPPTNLSDNLSSSEETHPLNEYLYKPSPPDDTPLSTEPHPPDELQPSLSLEFSDEEEEEEEGEGGTASLPPRVDLHRASHFICIADEEVEEVWQEHVSNLSRSKSLSLAVNTFYLFHRLFLVVRQQTCSLTQDAISFMSEGLWNISTHFLVTIELLSTQLELPRIYLDTELISLTKLLDPLVFFALETQNNLEHFESQRSTLLQCINDCKQAVISSCSPPPPLSPTSSFSMHQKSLTLCHSVHQIHFQLLLLVSGYIKLLHLLRSSLHSLPVIDISSQLTHIRRQLSGILSDRSHDLVSGRLDREIEEHVMSLKPEQAMRYLQDTIATNGPLLAIQLLHSMRSYFRDEQLFGIDSSDTLDVLLYGYAHCLAEGQEGVIGLTTSEHNISETHSHLMTQNVSLLALLEKQQLPEGYTTTEL